MNRIWLSFLFCICMTSVIQAQKIAVKSNLVYDATATLNIGAEYAVNKKFSIDLSGNFNGWDLKNDGTSWQHYMIQPEFRYWLHESFNGHFFGVHGIYTGYNLARLELPLFDFQRKYMYDGSAFGGGISYGYQLYMTPRLNIEFSLGVGFVNFEYDKILYRERDNAATTEPDFAGPNGLVGRYSKSYLGPTKLGISIVYIIN